MAVFSGLRVPPIPCVAGHLFQRRTPAGLAGRAGCARVLFLFFLDRTAAGLGLTSMMKLSPFETLQSAGRPDGSIPYDASVAAGPGRRLITRTAAPADRRGSGVPLSHGAARSRRGWSVGCQAVDRYTDEAGGRSRGTRGYSPSRPPLSRQVC